MKNLVLTEMIPKKAWINQLRSRYNLVLPLSFSLLDRLRSPTLADLSRKRYLRQNPPPKGVKMGKGKEKGDHISGKKKLALASIEESRIRKPYMCMTVEPD